MNIPAMQDTAIIAVVVLALICGALVYWIYSRPSDESFGKNDDLRHFQRRQRDRRARTSSWFGALVIIIIFFGLIAWRTEAERDLVQVSAERDREQLAAAMRVAGCDEQQQGDTDIVLLTISTSADAHTERPLASCTRYVARSYLKMHSEAIAKAAP